MSSSLLTSLTGFSTSLVLPVGARLGDPPHLDAFEGAPGSQGYVDVGVAVGVAALARRRALWTGGPAGVEDPLCGCVTDRAEHDAVAHTHRITSRVRIVSVQHLPKEVRLPWQSTLY